MKKIFLLILVFVLGANAQDSYVRKNDNLETAITTFSLTYRGQEKKVALIGVIHIADKAYYEEIQKRLDSYDTVLFELVTQTAIDRIKQPLPKSTSSVGSLQAALAKYLDLSYQLHAIDYTRSNMLRADMTSQELADTMKARDESFLKMYFKALSLQTDKPSTTSVMDLAMLLLPGTRSLQLRRMLAEEFSNLDEFLAAFNGGEDISLLSARNDVALKKLIEVLDKNSSVAIFYGAAHMLDFEKKLLRDFSAKKVGVEWLEAWMLK